MTYVGEDVDTKSDSHAAERCVNRILLPLSDLFVLRLVTHSARNYESTSQPTSANSPGLT